MLCFLIFYQMRVIKKGAESYNSWFQCRRMIKSFVITLSGREKAQFVNALIGETTSENKAKSCQWYSQLKSLLKAQVLRARVIGYGGLFMMYFYYGRLYASRDKRVRGDETNYSAQMLIVSAKLRRHHMGLSIMKTNDHIHKKVHSFHSLGCSVTQVKRFST